MVEVDNQFELLYDEKLKVNQRRSYTLPVYPIQELAQSPTYDILPVLLFANKINRS